VGAVVGVAAAAAAVVVMMIMQHSTVLSQIGGQGIIYKCLLRSACHRT
jgi:hypothetical protein